MATTLYMKLHAIQVAIEKFKKDGDTSSPENKKGYKYVTGDQVLSAVKPLMNEHKLILKQEVVSLINVRQDYKNRWGDKAEILSTLNMKFTWIDCESGEKDESLFSANGQNDWDKGVGSALTYGERYFLLKFFHIPTDDDDLDALEKKRKAEQQQQNQNQNTNQNQKQQQKKVLSFDQASTLLKGCKTIDVLAQTFRSLTPEMQKQTEAIKNELKTSLTEKKE